MTTGRPVAFVAQTVLERGMLRTETPDGWILIEHREHAQFAGQLAEHWGNASFIPPEPLEDILVGVAHHDDAWSSRDSVPSLTREGRPSAFSKELVGRYSAFEEIDFADYLHVRGCATEVLAGENPFAAILVSMHTVNLLTEQADLTRLSPAERELHGHFVSRQRTRQCELAESYCKKGGDPECIAPVRLKRAFEFLQACDNLSLLACVRFPEASFLRHTHPQKDGTSTRIRCVPLGGNVYRIIPYPFDCDYLVFTVPSRVLSGLRWNTAQAFQAEYARAAVTPIQIRIVR